jgi:hypothetical protein
MRNLGATRRRVGKLGLPGGCMWLVGPSRPCLWDSMALLCSYRTKTCDLPGLSSAAAFVIEISRTCRLLSICNKALTSHIVDDAISLYSSPRRLGRGNMPDMSAPLFSTRVPNSERSEVRQTARGAGIPRGGSLRSSQTGLDRPTTLPKRSSTWVRTKDCWLVSIDIATDPPPRAAAP